jgi:RimJ/RimL family protein N-acetyltransferase
MRKIQFHHDDDVLDFLREELALDLRGQDLDNPDRWMFAVAKNDHGAVVGVIVFEAKTWFDWHMSAAIVDGEQLSIPRVLSLIWKTIFTRAVRVTMLIDPENERAERQARRLGGQYEGFLRRGLDGTRDALVFGMLREDCRYLKPAQQPPLVPPEASAAMH